MFYNLWPQDVPGLELEGERFRKDFPVQPWQQVVNVMNQSKNSRYFFMAPFSSFLQSSRPLLSPQNSSKPLPPFESQELFSFIFATCQLLHCLASGHLWVISGGDLWYFLAACNRLTDPTYYTWGQDSFMKTQIGYHWTWGRLTIM